MIITQKYNSAFDIDPEFIPSLESLLENCTPSFNLIKNYEKSACENTNFTYFLFFGNKTNSPIGFAQLEIKKGKTIRKKFFSKLFKRDLLTPTNEHQISWSIPGALKEGIVFEPMYTKHACEKAQKIFTEFFEREDIYSQELTYSDAYEEMHKLSNQQTASKKNQIIPETLIKNRSNYEEFFSHLSKETQAHIKSSWKTVYRDLQYKMGDFNQFKDVFGYKSEGAKQYKELKKNPMIEKYIGLENKVHFLSLENNKEVKLLVLLIEGSGINSFYEIYSFDDSIPKIIPHQMAIMKFYELDNANRLHCLCSEDAEKELIDFGFTSRNQFHLTVHRSQQ